MVNYRIGYSVPMFCGFIIMFVSTVSEYFSIPPPPPPLTVLLLLSIFYTIRVIRADNCTEERKGNREKSEVWKFY